MRKALKPTLFFMSHCSQNLHDNLLKVNWSPDLLNNVTPFQKSYAIYIKLHLHSKSLKSVTNLKIDDTPFFLK